MPVLGEGGAARHDELADEDGRAEPAVPTAGRRLAQQIDTVRRDRAVGRERPPQAAPADQAAGGHRITFLTLHVFEFEDGKSSRENVWQDGASIVARLTAP
ncbi:hypothetical protein [Streptomyces sp. NPDC001100]